MGRKSLDNVEFKRPVYLHGGSSQVCYVELSFPGSDFACLASFIYAKCSTVEHRDLWENLISFGANATAPWIIGGDYM